MRLLEAMDDPQRIVLDSSVFDRPPSSGGTQ